jgi:hypothetical protein
MTKIKFSQLIAGALFSLCLATVPARALSLQTYVSGKGTDTGACATPATACRTFAFAIVQTANSGEIKAIDPANYGPVTITKAISIVGHDGAGIALASGTAIAVTAGASDSINLRGLTLDGAGTASQGIFLSSAGSATITNCFVHHFKDLGIQLQSGAALSFIISNTISSDQVSNIGLAIGGTTGVIKGVVDHFAASDNELGISVAANGKLVEV